MRSALILSALLLASCDSSSSDAPSATSNPAAAWEIGPIIDGKNYSEGVPLHPAVVADGFAIPIPQLPGSVHYVTAQLGPLDGKRLIRLRYRIDADPSVELHAKSILGSTPAIAVYFQRRGDDWSGLGKYETYRWYAAFVAHEPIRDGQQEIVAPLDGAWSAVMGSTAKDHPADFEAAKANANRVGFVMGGGTGYGHGVYATGRATITYTLTVE